MFKSARYLAWRNAVPPAFSNQKAFNVEIPVERQWVNAKRRYLLVLEHVDTEDLRKGKLLTGPSGHWIESAIDLGMEYAKHHNPKRPAFAAVNFNFFKTYNLDGHDASRANAMAADRVRALAKKLDATDVIVFGDTASTYLCNRAHKDERTLLLRRGRPTEYDGRWWTTTISPSSAYQGKFATESDEEDEQESKIDHANLLGFVGRCVGNALIRKLVYSFDVEPKVTFVNTFDKFKVVYRKLMAADQVAVDTETTSLGRVVNKVLTLQFAFDGDTSYVIPLDHKEAPWTPEEKRKIEKGLRNFFARDFDPLSKRYDQFLLGQNLKFDMTVIRQRFQIHMLRWRVWDMMAGEYSLDENIKGLLKCRTPNSGRISPYSLEWMCAWYGCDFYAKNAFSKDDRATIETRSLQEKGLLEYCGVDAQVCWLIKEQQCARAQRVIVGGKPYGKRYQQFVTTQMNNLVQIESVMEHRGDQLDMPYLIKLKDANGPLSTVKREVEFEFRKFDSVRKTNARLVNTEGIPRKTLFGGVPWIFSITRPAHKLALFIDTMRLEPLSYGKSGAAKIDKAFQEEYKDKPEVAAFTQLSQLDKLKSTYVNGFYDKLKTDPDMKTDFRIRPGFGFTGTVTGRSNSYDPNLQNIPARGKFAKFIKRMFVAPRGCLTLKMDYSAHEVRIWGIISGDTLLCSLFINGRWLRQKYRETGKSVYKQLMDTKGDIHKVNCVAGDTLVATDRGLVRIDTLGTSGVERLSVSTMTHGGIATTSHWKHSGVSETLTIKTELGNEVTVTADHRVAVWDDSVDAFTWKQAKNVTTQDVLVLAPNGVVRKTRLDLNIPPIDLHHNAKPLSRLPKVMTTDLAWLIGCLVSEGSIGSYQSGNFVTFSNSDRRLTDTFVNTFHKVFGEHLVIGRVDHDRPPSIDCVTTNTKPHYGVRMSSMHLVQVLNYLGLYTHTGRVDNKIASWRKVVPWSVLQADEESQMAFMAAYLECDGNVENHSGVLRWFSVSTTMIAQMRTLLNTHGAFPATGTWSTVQALTLTGVDYLSIWPKLSPYMVTKNLAVKPRLTKFGVPAAFWSNLITSRLSKRGRVATNDTGKEGYYKLRATAKAKYRFSKVVSTASAGKQAVFDLTMSGDYPSFVANGILVHNCEFFFKTEAKDVTSEQRNSVKSIVFGAIYGRGAKAISVQAGATVDAIKKILEAFFARFKRASKWLADAKAYAVKHSYMYSPIWRIRNMYTQMYGLSNLVAATERRGCNAPIQGFAADIGHTAAYLYQIHIERVVRMFELDKDKILRAGVNTFVHDAIKTDAPYEYLLVCLQVLQWCATTGAMEYYKTHWNINFPVEIEVEFEFAAHDESHWKWSWNENNEPTMDKGKVVGGGLQFVIRKSLEDQKEVYPEIDVDAIEKQIWAVRKNKELVAYLNKHYPILADWPDSKHIDINSSEFKNGLGKAIREAEREVKTA